MPVREKRLDAVRDPLRDLELRELPLPADSAGKLADLRASTNLKMPDCWVLLAAQDAGARLASFDDRLADAAASRELVTLRNRRHRHRLDSGSSIPGYGTDLAQRSNSPLTSSGTSFCGKWPTPSRTRHSYVPVTNCPEP